jgi:4-hydroxy-tetrahydrodipicolinate synthase
MLVTPFRPAGQVDLDDLGRLLDFVIASRPHGVSILGLGGEVGSLTVDERRAIADLVLRGSGALPVIVGCSAQDTRTAVELARHAAERGAAAVMVASPSEADWGRDRLGEHFVSVARACAPTPVMVQDAPAFIGVALDADLVRDLAAAEPNIAYAKPESLPACESASRLAEAGLAVFGGHGGLYALDVLEAGAVGLIPGCEAGDALARLFDHWDAGRLEEARAAHDTLAPLLTFEFQGLDHFIRCAKTILQAQGVLRRAGSRANPGPLDPVSMRLVLDRATRAGILAPGAAAPGVAAPGAAEPGAAAPGAAPGVTPAATCGRA